ncbi:DUF3080 family protein [Methylocaldum sp.]|uniref:DUF3080 family protein n=1 Tax=Methylocaldum sp. TaxID=1969727 RepID=UPI002D3E406C|nr:DUF3080 family protein [Methylocaldum sp.]HYE36895.1 DUF3080 family protein [Methylocaldum sp.]
MRFIVIVLVLGLAGCGGDSPEAMFENYLERLANVTEIKIDEAAAPPAVPPYPRARDIVLPVDDIRIGVITYLEMTRCGLIGEISGRNSSLGRVQRETGRFLYELNVFRKLSECEAELQSSEEDQDFDRKIKSIRQAKAENLPKAFWNATFAAKEFRVFMDTATNPLQRDEKISAARFERPIRYLASLGSKLEEAPSIPPNEFEQRYFELQADKTGGKIVRALSLSGFYLDRVARLLEQAASTGRICPMGKKTRQAEYLFNVFVKFYAGEVQPYISRLHQTASPLLESMRYLKENQRVEIPPVFESYYAVILDPGNDQGLWHHFNAALQRHTRAWQSILKPCGMMPGGPAT